MDWVQQCQQASQQPLQSSVRDRLRVALTQLSLTDVQSEIEKHCQDPHSVQSMLTGAVAALKPNQLDSTADKTKCSAAAAMLLTNSISKLDDVPAADVQGFSSSLLKLMVHCDFLSDVDAVQVVETSLRCFHSSSHASVCALAVLVPTLAYLVRTGHPIKRPDALDEDAALPVQHYHKLIMQKVCRCPWQTASLSEILNCLNSRQIMADFIPEVLKKAVEACSKPGHLDLVATAQQLIRLCSDSHKGEMMQAIISIVAAMGATASLQTDQQCMLCEQQSSLLQFFQQKLPTNSDLGQAWLKHLKGCHSQGSPFQLALMLVASQCISRLPFLETLEGMVLSAYEAEQQLRSSAWLASLPALPGPDGHILEQALITCVSNMAACPKSGWTAAAKPLIGFAVALLEKGTVKAAELADLFDGEEAAIAGSSQAAAAHLGIKLLVSIFGAVPSAQEGLLREIQSKLVGVKEDTSLPFVATLAQLVYKYPKAVLEHAEILKAALDRFAFMTATTALGVLIALQPLALLKKHIQAYMVGARGVLRKALFSRGVPSRLVAVRGLLYMIVQQLRDLESKEDEDAMEADAELSCSQSLPASQQPSMSAGVGGVTLLHELMGLMRRCLSQPAPIREALYQGVHAILVADPSVQDSVLELLMPHFVQFIQTQGAPLKLSDCANAQGDAVAVHEPLDVLLACIRQVMLLAKPRDRQQPDSIMQSTDLDTVPSVLRGGLESSQEANQVLQTRFDQLRGQLVNCDLKDFVFDADTDWSAHSAQGLVHQAQASLLAGSLEVMIEDVVTEAGAQEPAAAAGAEEQLTKLFATHDSLCSLAQEGKNGKTRKATDGATQGPTQKRGRPANNVSSTQASMASSVAVTASAFVCTDMRTPVLTVACLSKLLHAMVADENAAAEYMEERAESGQAGQSQQVKALSEVAKNIATQAFVLQSCLRLLKSCKASPEQQAIIIGTAGDVSNRAVAKQLLAPPDWRQLAGPLIRAVKSIVLTFEIRKTSPSGRGKGRPGGDKLTLMALECLDELLRLGKTAQVVAGMLQDALGISEQPIRPSECQIIRQHLPLLHNMLQQLLATGRHKEAEMLMHTMSFLGSLLPAAMQQQLGQWVSDACQNPDLKVNHIGAVKALAGLQLSFAGPGLQACLLTAKGIEQVVGSINMDARPQSDILLVVSTKTSAAVASTLFSQLEAVLQAIEWLLGTLTKPALAGSSPDRQKGAQEQSACVRLEALAEVLGVAVQSSFKGTAADHLTRLLLSMYKLLKAVTLLLKAPQKSQQASPSAAFQAMVSMVHQQLTPHVYSFTLDASNLDADDDAQNKPPNAEKKAKKAKKEGKQIGLLVKAIEEWELNLIKLTRNCGVNLMRHAKKSTNRDFKVTFKALPEPEEDEAETEDDEAAQRESSPPSNAKDDGEAEA